MAPANYKKSMFLSRKCGIIVYYSYAHMVNLEPEKRRTSRGYLHFSSQEKKVHQTDNRYRHVSSSRIGHTQ
jgi:hypothetical protein